MARIAPCCGGVPLTYSDISVQDAGASAVPKQGSQGSCAALACSPAGCSRAGGYAGPVRRKQLRLRRATLPGHPFHWPMLLLGVGQKGEAMHLPMPVRRADLFVAESGVAVLKAEEPAKSRQGFTQAAGSHAAGGQLPASALEQRSGKDAATRSSSRPASAEEVSVHTGRSGAGAGNVAEERIDYARVAERLRQKGCGIQGPRGHKEG